jgi:hypothetical protein
MITDENLDTTNQLNVKPDDLAGIKGDKPKDVEGWQTVGANKKGKRSVKKAVKSANSGVIGGKLKAKKAEKDSETIGDKVERAMENVGELGKNMDENTKLLDDENRFAGLDEQKDVDDSQNNMDEDDEDKSEGSITEKAGDVLREGWEKTKEVAHQVVEKTKDTAEWVGEKIKETFVPEEEGKSMDSETHNDQNKALDNNRDSI